MRIFFPLLLLFFTLTSAYAATQEWQRYGKNAFSTPSYQVKNMHALIGLNEAKEAGFWLLISNMEKICKEKAETTFPFSFFIINGTKVNTRAYCHGVDFYVSPATLEERDFIVSEFKRRDAVIMKLDEQMKLTFSSKGFSKAWNKLLNN